MTSTSTAAIEADLRGSLAAIRRMWPHPDVPPARSSKRPVPGPRPLVTDAWLARQSIIDDLAYWTQTARDDGIAVPAQRVDLTDPLATTSHLLAHCRALSGWEYAPRMASELRQHEGALRRLTTVPPEGVRLGDCPRPRPITDDDGRRTEVPCSGTIYAAPKEASDVKCPRCGHTTTVEGWRDLMVDDMVPMTAQDLAQVLLRFGVRTTALGIRQRVGRGTIPPPVGEDTRGRALYDPGTTLHALASREARRGA